MLFIYKAFYIMPKFWDAYNDVGDPFSASSYAKINLPNKPSCTNGSDACAIYASLVNTSPDTPFSTNFTTIYRSFFDRRRTSTTERFW